MTSFAAPAVLPDSERLLTELDHQRLRRHASAHGALRDLLDNADLLPSPQLPGDVVSMNSEVEVFDQANGRLQRLTLCYPAEADAEQGRISVLSPVGLSLLGRAVGSQARWQAAPGTVGALHIHALRYQPEASGDFHR
jgi:regulator of nucleoside diphosphate kinase